MVGKQRNPRKTVPPAERFWPKVDKRGEHECWLWKASGNALGYGQFNIGGKMRRAHRVAYELTVGPIAQGMVIDHLCGVRGCVNPGHLRLVTQRENMLGSAMPNAGLAARTHCSRGHAFDEANTYYRPDGGRRCRKCLVIQVTRSGLRYQALLSGTGLELDQEEAGWDATRLLHEVRRLRAENARLRAQLVLPLAHEN
jgi:hypothetical protein